MLSTTIAHQRLVQQRLSHNPLANPGEIVGWLGAVQAQDYLGSLWAIGLRTEHATMADIEQAVADRTIVRTWPMRGTLHFVAPEDVRWMLELLTPRIIARNAVQYRRVGLDDTIFSRSCDTLVKALQGGKQLSRNAIYKVLAAAGISTDGLRGLFILAWLAQKGVICFGARQGKQQTFALLEEWVPAAKTMERDQALAELARRYFTSHGPATLQDFIWWTGLTAGDARAGLEMVKSQFNQEAINGQAYYRSPSALPSSVAPSTAYLLPPFDEYAVAYTDRSAVLDPVHTQQAGYGIGPTMVLGGQIVGTWKRTIKKDAIVIEATPFISLSNAGIRLFTDAAERYGEFMGLPVALGWANKNFTPTS